MFLFADTIYHLKMETLAGSDRVLDKVSLGGRRLSLHWHDPEKPVSDSFFHTDAKRAVIFEGVVANARDLVNEYAAAGRRELVLDAVSDPALTRLGGFHGQFCGLYLDLATGLTRVFTNQINSLRIYYYSSPETFIASTSLKLITDLLRANGISLTVDETGARILLTYGFLLAGLTTVREIRQLQAGQVLESGSGKPCIRSYHRFNNEIRRTSLSPAITELNALFQKAVRAALERDEEAGKIHLAFLSGGLDSRQTVTTAVKLGFRDLHCLNFAEPGCLDAIVARRITHKLGLKLIYNSLQRGSYLLEIDRNLQYNHGQILLNGSAHLFHAISALNLMDYGILHSGMIGDAVLGSFLHAPHQEKPNLTNGAYSRKLFDTVRSEVDFLAGEYANNELFLFYTRAFCAATNGDLACAVQSWSVSPFLDPEFAQFCLNIDPQLRFNNLCYREWMLRCNRIAARFRWDKTGLPPRAPQWVIRFRRTYVVYKTELLKRLTGIEDRTSMNPFDLWWRANPALPAHFDCAFEKLRSLEHLLSPELAKDTRELYASRFVTDKMLAYSLVAGLDYLFNP